MLILHLISVVIQQFISSEDVCYRGVAWHFEDVRTRIYFSQTPKALTSRGVWGHAPPENFEI